MEEMKVTYESPDFLIVDKPAGMIVHRVKGATGDREGARYLTDALILQYPELSKVGDDPEWRPGIVHRLDKDTSGVMVIPRTQEYFEYLKKLFQEKKVHKTYKALVYGVIKDDFGTINRPIGLKGGTTKRTVHGGKMIKEAVTDYRVLERYDDFTLVEVMPQTGRTHQIRVHLAFLGYPIVGDTLYGGKKQKKSLLAAGRQFLHAYSIEFDPTPGHRATFVSELPEDLSGILAKLA
ncbi:MAG: RluA family pseudouridine synthase [Candidatus Colwellbacteria bacterium]|nr:RluA family pseudouridine synthase [Candidatus Colwellbacteria bacterium]